MMTSIFSRSPEPPAAKQPQSIKGPSPYCYFHYRTVFTEETDEQLTTFSAADLVTLSFLC